MNWQLLYDTGVSMPSREIQDNGNWIDVGKLGIKNLSKEDLETILYSLDDDLKVC